MEKQFEKTVKKALIDKDMTYTSLAKKMELSTTYVSEIIKGYKKGPKAQERIEEIKTILDMK